MRTKKNKEKYLRFVGRAFRTTTKTDCVVTHTPFVLYPLHSNNRYISSTIRASDATAPPPQREVLHWFWSSSLSWKRNHCINGLGTTDLSEIIVSSCCYFCVARKSPNNLAVGSYIHPSHPASGSLPTAVANHQRREATLSHSHG